MRIYLYSKCSTCKEALRFLNEHNIQLEVLEITTIPPSIEELTSMLHFQNGNLKKLFNTSGNLYRDMQLAEKLNTIPLEEALILLSAHGMLVKRPFLLDKNFGLLGFKKEEWLTKLTE
jgi:arsenate reductase (glutaredoxin)